MIFNRLAHTMSGPPAILDGGPSAGPALAAYPPKSFSHTLTTLQQRSISSSALILGLGMDIGMWFRAMADSPPLFSNP